MKIKQTVLTLLTLVLAGCSTITPTSTPANSPNASPLAQSVPVDVNVKVMSGPTGMGLVQFFDSIDNGEVITNNYHYSIETGSDPVTSALVKGEVDIAAIPANTAAVLYQKTEGQLQVIAINTLGVLSIVENGDTIHCVADLKGKTIVASGKDSVPEYALNYILTGNGLTPGEDVTIEWKSEQNEVVAALAANSDAIAMLPQPFATAAMNKVEGLHSALDLTSEWNAVQQVNGQDGQMVTGVVVARKEFIDNNPSVINEFLDYYQQSVDYVNTNVEDAATLVGNYGIVDAKIATKALPNCSIVCIRGSEMQPILENYYDVLFNANPKSVGGKLPDANFYYVD